MRVSLCLLAALVLSSAAALADDTEVTRRVCTGADGRKLWEASVAIRPAGTGAGHYLMTEEIDGNYSAFKVRTVSKSELEYINDNKTLSPLYMKRHVVSEDGKALLEETQRYDPEKRTVDCVLKNSSRKAETKKTLRYKGEMINSMLMGAYIKRFLTEGAKEKTVSLVSDGPSVYKITLKVEDKEEITVNGRKYSAYRILIDPEIGLFSPVKGFIPKNYVWYSTEPPYDWLMFRGLESSFGSPKVEMTSLDN